MDVKPKLGQRGRPISFDKNQLLHAVMHKFWAQGYNQVSLNEIAKDHGLTRASLYHSFRSKEALFLQALVLYQRDCADKALDQTPMPSSATVQLFSLLDNICQARADDEQNRGCLICNCASEFIGNNDALASHLQQLLEKRRGTVHSLMQQAVNSGELPTTSDPSLLSDLFMNFLFGLNLFSKTTSSAKSLQSLCDGFMTSLGFQRQAESRH